MGGAIGGAMGGVSAVWKKKAELGTHIFNFSSQRL